MKRRLLKLGLLLLAGAIVNVAVAWALAISGPLKNKAEKTTGFGDHDEQWYEEIGLRGVFPADGVTYWARALKGSAVEYRWGIASSPGSSQNDFVLIVRAGFPMQSMVGWKADSLAHAGELYHSTTWWNPVSGLPLMSDCETCRAIELPSDWHSSATLGRFLPVFPRWPGFAINTIFYAAIVWLLFFAPFKLRRWRRIKRGLCPACAYPFGTSDKCTECGAPLELKQTNPRNDSRTEAALRRPC